MLLTVVQVDLVGYSDIAASLEQNLGTESVLGLNRQIQALIDEGLNLAGLDREASVAVLTGDGAILVVQTPEVGHKFALGLHSAARNHNSNKTDSTALRVFRIGTATGDVIKHVSSDGSVEIAGLTIARAVRLEAAAPPGGCLVDKQTFDSLPEHLTGCYSDEETVAGKRDERFVARRCLPYPEAAELLNYESPKRADTIPTTGPVPSTALHSFKDRTAELPWLIDRLSDPKIRFVSVCGRGGIGKTTLVSKLLESLREGERRPESGTWRPDGVVYVSFRLNHLRSLDKVVDLIANVLGDDGRMLRDRWNQNLPIAEKLDELFRQTLNSRSLLIVLDNFEDILGHENRIAADFADIREFLDAAMEYDHQSRFLATSRRAIVFSTDVEGRAGLCKAELALEEGLPLQESLELLGELDADGHLGIRGANAATLRNIIERCHGVPRLLESVIGTLRQRRTWTIERLIQDPQTIDRLTNDPTQELYESLNADQQSVVQALAVYGQPTSVEAVSHLVSELGVDQALDDLVRDYVVHYDSGLFSLHPLDQSYAYRQIDEQRQTELHQQAAAFCHTLRKPREQWRSLVDLEPQLREFEHLLGAGLADRAAEVMNEIDEHFLLMWSHATLIVQLRSRLLQQSLTDQLQLGNLRSLSAATIHLANPQTTIEYGRAGLEIARRIGDRNSESWCLNNLGSAYTYRGEPREALQYHHSALEISRELNDENTKGLFLNALGMTHCTLGSMDEFFACIEEALPLLRKHGNQRAEAIGVHNLSLAHWNLGNLDKSLEAAERALEIARSLSDRRTEAFAMHKRGLIAWELAQPETAIDRYNEALDLAQKTGDRRVEIFCHFGLGMACTDLGRLSVAASHFENAVRVARDVEDRWSESISLTFWAAADQKQADYESAMQRGTAAMALAQGAGDPRAESMALGVLATIHAAQERFDQSVEHAAKALSCAEQNQYRSGISLQHCNWGYGLHHQGELQAAQDHYEVAVGLDVIRTRYRANFLLGLLLQSSGDLSAAEARLNHSIDCCYRILNKAPGFIDVGAALSLSYLALGQTDSALAECRNLLGRCPAEGVLQDMLQDCRLVERSDGVDFFTTTLRAELS